MAVERHAMGEPPKWESISEVTATTHVSAATALAAARRLLACTRMWVCAVPFMAGEGWDWHEYESRGPGAEAVRCNNTYAVTTIRPPEFGLREPTSYREFDAPDALAAAMIARASVNPGTTFWVAQVPSGPEAAWRWLELVHSEAVGGDAATSFDEVTACIAAGARLVELVNAYLETSYKVTGQLHRAVQYITGVSASRGISLRWSDVDDAVVLTAADLADPLASIQAKQRAQAEEIELLKKLMKKHPHVVRG